MTQQNDLLHQLTQAVLCGDALQARVLAQEIYRHPSQLALATPPASTDPTMLALAAGLLELFAQRLNQPSPAWTQLVGALPEPLYLLKAAHTMRRLRELCETQSPEPLRRHTLYASPNYLEMA